MTKITSTFITEITTEISWDLDVVFGQNLAVVLFCSEKSSPSLKMIEIIAGVMGSVKNVKFFLVDVDKNPDITWRFRVSIVPTIMLFWRGQKLEELITLKKQQEIEEVINRYV